MEVLVEVLGLFLFEVFGQVLADLCCSGLVTVFVDTLTGVAACQSYQKRKVRKESRQRGEEPPSIGYWPWIFWLFLPVSLLFTSFFVGRWIFG